jgi:hypothetical protein
MDIIFNILSTDALTALADMNEQEVIVIDGSDDDGKSKERSLLLRTQDDDQACKREKPSTDSVENKPSPPCPRELQGNTSTHGAERLPSAVRTNEPQKTQPISDASNLEEKSPIPHAKSAAVSEPPHGTVYYHARGKKRSSHREPRVPASAPPILTTLTPRYTRAKWPHHVVNLRTHFNPDAIVLPFSKPFGTCGCQSNCRYGHCRNSKLGLFCAVNCCPFAGACGSGLEESKNLVLAKDLRTSAFAVIAAKTIPPRIVIGEYFGRLKLQPPTKERIRHRGYTMLLKSSPSHCGLWRAAIDAETFGGMMRFVNHSCDASCRFVQLSNGFTHTVAVVTLREIDAGEEITVSYGDSLWFVCRCGHDQCCHRDIQHLQNA